MRWKGRRLLTPSTWAQVRRSCRTVAFLPVAGTQDGLRLAELLCGLPNCWRCVLLLLPCCRRCWWCCHATTVTSAATAAFADFHTATARLYSSSLRRPSTLFSRRVAAPPLQAAASSLPDVLVEKLKPGGRMVIPVGAQWEFQVLLSSQLTASHKRSSAAKRLGGCDEGLRMLRECAQSASYLVPAAYPPACR